MYSLPTLNCRLHVIPVRVPFLVRGGSVEMSVVHGSVDHISRDDSFSFEFIYLGGFQSKLAVGKLLFP